MSANVFIDTGVLLRFTLTGMKDPRDERKCKDQLNRYFEEGTELWISNQVIREFCVRATHSRTYEKPLSGKQVIHKVLSFPGRFRIAEETPAVRQKLLELIESYGMEGAQIHDANYVATMLEYGVDTICTLNLRHFRRFERRKIIRIDEPRANPR
ncbi:MAG: type II toxin-antitoxin system VapC family toxin [Chloroflexi bacterium]|nr:type II toxin-antitoxin system VapC family toxin [Chloroflexota bacterium]